MILLVNIISCCLKHIQCYCIQSILYKTLSHLYESSTLLCLPLHSCPCLYSLSVTYYCSSFQQFDSHTTLLIFVFLSSRNDVLILLCVAYKVIRSLAILKYYENSLDLYMGKKQKCTYSTITWCGGGGGCEHKKIISSLILIYSSVTGTHFCVTLFILTIQFITLKQSTLGQVER